MTLLTLMILILKNRVLDKKSSSDVFIYCIRYKIPYCTEYLKIRINFDGFWFPKKSNFEIAKGNYPRMITYISNEEQ